MVRALKESMEVLVWSIGLKSSCVPVSYHVETLVAWNAVVKRGRRYRKLKWTIWNNLWLFPSFLLRPVYRQHVISVMSSKKHLVPLWFWELHGSLGELDIRGLNDNWSSESKSKINLPWKYRIDSFPLLWFLSLATLYPYSCASLEELPQMPLIELELVQRSILDFLLAF